MYTFKDECTLSKMNVHLKILCLFLIQSWMNTCNKVDFNLNEQLLRQVKCMRTKMYVHLQSNVPQQIWMYTYKDLCTQPTNLKFKDLNVHFQRWIYT